MEIRIALAGNPNCGKTTLFNALTGANQYVGNWPGVTVEKKEGKLKKHDGVTVVDLPGIYSLSPYTPEEIVARKFLLEEKPDVVLNIVDGSNLERNLYLTTQLLEVGLPVVIAINMMDVVKKRGDIINAEELSRQLGCRVTEISALKNEGVNEAAETAIAAAIEAAKAKVTVCHHPFSGAVEHAIAHIEEAAVHNLPENEQRWYAVKIFERDKQAREKLNLPQEVLDHVEKDVVAAEKELGEDAETIITNERYLFVGEVMKACYIKKDANALTASDKIDRILTHPVWAFPFLAVIMFLVYFVSVTLIGGWVTDWMNDGVFGEGFSFFNRWVPGLPVLIERGLTAINCAAWLQSLIIDGMVAGVGAVLGFLPQLFVLFFCLSFLEACGYMSRIAFVLERLFRKFGLSGKSFIPMLIGTGCGVPGIMASRTIENEHDRRITIITTTFIPCGAKVPFIAMIAGVLFGGAWWVAPSAYFLGMAAIVVSGVILKKTKALGGEPAPFIMELPDYHMPGMKSVLLSMWERGKAFIKQAGTIILLSTVVIWFLSRFGWVGGSFGLLAEEDVEFSILAKIGNAVRWLFAPIGFGSWQATVASFTGLAAKENIVATTEILYGGDAGIREAFTKISGYSFLIFNLLCAPCMAAIGAIKQEMHSAKWTWIAIGYQCGFAYVIAFIFYHAASMLSGNLVGGFTGVACFILALALLAGMIYLLFRPYKEPEHLKNAAAQK